MREVVMDLTLSFRNIWRNPRRTGVILTAVLVGVWNMLLLAALTHGIETAMVKNALNDLTGSIQIHHAAYLDDPVVDYSIDDAAPVDAVLSEHLPKGSAWAHRIRVSTVVSNARHTSGVTLVGIDPDREARISFIGGAVIDGRYLTPEDSAAVLVGRSFLKRFETRIGHKLIVMNRDRDGNIVSRAFRITGVFRAETEAMETGRIFVVRQSAATLLGLGTAFSETAIRLPETDLAGQTEQTVADRLSQVLGEPLQVSTWRDRLPMIRAYLDSNDFFLYIWYGVVFVAMGFGVVNTTLMAVYERMREFGLLKALGMTPYRIIGGVLLESGLILGIGTVLGALAGVVTVVLLAPSGIDLSALAAGADMWSMPRVIRPLLRVSDVLIVGVVVMVLGLLVSLYPAIKAARFTPVQAMNVH
jgi:ABC-type lipoprotein release transport system permease subunit